MASPSKRSRAWLADEIRAAIKAARDARYPDGFAMSGQPIYRDRHEVRCFIMGWLMHASGIDDAEGRALLDGLPEVESK